MPYKNNTLVLPQEIYETQLKKINAAALSQREIDIIQQDIAHLLQMPAYSQTERDYLFQIQQFIQKIHIDYHMICPQCDNQYH